MYGLSLTPDGGTAVHVFRCVFEQAVTPVMVLDVVEGDGLKAPPAQRQDKRVTGFQDTIVPAVFLQTHLCGGDKERTGIFFSKSCLVMTFGLESKVSFTLFTRLSTTLEVVKYTIVQICPYRLTCK